MQIFYFTGFVLFDQCAPSVEKGWVEEPWTWKTFSRQVMVLYFQIQGGFFWSALKSARPLDNSDTQNFFLEGFTFNMTLSHFLGRTSKKNTLYVAYVDIHCQLCPTLQNVCDILILRVVYLWSI